MEPPFSFQLENDCHLHNRISYAINGYTWSQYEFQSTQPIKAQISAIASSSAVLIVLKGQIQIIDGHFCTRRPGIKQFVFLKNKVDYRIIASIHAHILILTSANHSIAVKHMGTYNVPSSVMRIIKQIDRSKLTGQSFDLKVQSAVAETIEALTSLVSSYDLILEQSLSSEAKAKLALDHILQNFQDPYLGGLNEIASRFYINRNSLSKAFALLTSETIPCFIRRKRIEHACKLLKTTNKLVSEIAEECGYTDTANFIRSFRSIMNTTPRLYRLHQSDNRM